MKEKDKTRNLDLELDRARDRASARAAARVIEWHKALAKDRAFNDARSSAKNEKKGGE